MKKFYFENIRDLDDKNGNVPNYLSKQMNFDPSKKF